MTGSTLGQLGMTETMLRQTGTILAATGIILGRIGNNDAGSTRMILESQWGNTWVHIDITQRVTGIILGLTGSGCEQLESC